MTGKDIDRLGGLLTKSEWDRLRLRQPTLAASGTAPPPQPQGPQPGGLRQHLAETAPDSAALGRLLGGFPWHLADTGDHAALLAHLRDLPPGHFWDAVHHALNVLARGGLHAGA